MEGKAPIMAIRRHRIGTDGTGVHTLVCFPRCPLSCRFCLNPETSWSEEGFPHLSPEELLETVRKDDLYFRASGGGITFGGGEPALRSRFITAFRHLSPWKIDLETALNVPVETVDSLKDAVDHFFIDVKDMDSGIYRAYTGKDNTFVLRNLERLADRAEDCTLRLPLIPGYNNEESRRRSEETLKRMGFMHFDLFEYKTAIRDGKRQTNL